jgi:hypothetical protein
MSFHTRTDHSGNKIMAVAGFSVQTKLPLQQLGGGRNALERPARTGSRFARNGARALSIRGLADLGLADIVPPGDRD